MNQPAGLAAYCQSKARYSWSIFRKISPYDLPDRPVLHCVPGSVETQWNEASMRSGHEWNHILYIIYIELTQIEMSLDEAGVPFEGLL